MTEKKKLKKHNITPIGMIEAQAFVNNLLEKERKGRALGKRTARAFTLVLAYGAEVMAANHAANGVKHHDCTAIHQLKWRSIPVIDDMIENEVVSDYGYRPNDDFGKYILDFVKSKSDATPQELAALKIVLKYGAPVSEIEQFCGVKIAHLVEIAKELK